MAGDLDVKETAILEGVAGPEAFAATPPTGGYPIHRYGRVSIIAELGGPDSANSPPAGPMMALDRLNSVERLGLDALWLRQSPSFRLAKQTRPRAGESWDMHRCVSIGRVPENRSMAVGAQAAGPTSLYLEGKVAVGLVIVQGPTPELRFSEQELVKVVAEVQNGLGFLATSNPLAEVTFTYDIQNVALSIAADPSAPDLEAHWRNPAMGALGFSQDWAGVSAYVESIRTRLRTRWAYCAFVTKYPLGHFAYASIGGPRLVMDYNNDGWGPDNIDRVFAHETGHIFGCPDEYASSGCNCGGAWGRYGIANSNCENCAGGGGVQCLMKANTFNLCVHTRSHLGWSPRLVVGNLGYDAGGWRVDRHPRMLADTTGDGRADIVGFGNAGVYVARALTDGRHEAPQLVVANFGYVAGGWRVDRHPRLLVDTTGDGRADIVGFGNSGVYVSRARPDGTFTEPELVVANFGYSAGGWRVDRHPRFLADTTGDGRADIVGFGNSGVYVSRAHPDGTYAAPTLVLASFGYDAGGWRVDQHPRFLADTTGSGRADIVGFGNEGVWISRSRPDGTFAPPELVIANFGYVAGGWRVDRHPRFLADTTGDGRADIVGFGNAGVYVSRANDDGSYGAPELVVTNFGYNAGGWQVDRHPRFLADITGDGRADIVGFGDAGVYISRNLTAGGFDAPSLIIKNFGYNAGGWLVDRHPRFLADTTGDGRVDVVGFGNDGVWFSSM